jgi:hypothetical protein
VAVAEVVQEVLELGIDNNGIRIGMVEDIRDVIGFESVIDGCSRLSVCEGPLCNHTIGALVSIPTLTAPAAPMPKMLSKNAGVLVHRMPTLL